MLCLAHWIGWFQSAPSAWRATGSLRQSDPCPEVSIRALRVEGDSSHSYSSARVDRFQSAPSAWRATRHGQRPDDEAEVSIRALRVEGDQCYRRG